MANFSTNITRKKELEKVMKRYDTDGSGALSDEFRAALSQLNFRNRDADMLFVRMMQMEWTIKLC